MTLSWESARVQIPYSALLKIMYSMHIAIPLKKKKAEHIIVTIQTMKSKSGPTVLG